MLLVNTFIKKCKVCFLIRKIKKYQNMEKVRRSDLIERSLKYHNGRLEIDTLLEDELTKNKKEIYNLKRGIVKER